MNMDDRLFIVIIDDEAVSFSDRLAAIDYWDRMAKAGKPGAIMVAFNGDDLDRLPNRLRLPEKHVK